MLLKGFVWTDERVKEFVTLYGAGVGDVDVVNFKRSKEKPRKLLFISEDDVEIFEDDTFWCVDANGVGQFDICQNMTHWSFKYFSTEEAAKEYVLMNKPLNVSVQELMNRLHAYFKNPVMASKKEIF